MPYGERCESAGEPPAGSARRPTATTIARTPHHRHPTAPPRRTKQVPWRAARRDDPSRPIDRGSPLAETRTYVRSYTLTLCGARVVENFRQVVKAGRRPTEA